MMLSHKSNPPRPLPARLKIMDLTEWLPWYERIVKTFCYDPRRDQYATDILSQLLEGVAIPLAELRGMVEGKPVMVFGAGPSLREDIKTLVDHGLLDDFAKISADGATTALLEIAEKAPDIVVTDLDGIVSDLLKANRHGAVMVIHSHGDNIALIRRAVPKFRNKIGTTQTTPRPNVYNFGGFTDGDRAVFLSTELNARIIVLAGMDFGSTIGEYSKQEVKSVEVKRMKLKIGKELLSWLSTRTKIPLYNITARGGEITGFNTVTVEEVMKMV